MIHKNKQTKLREKEEMLEFKGKESHKTGKKKVRKGDQKYTQK